MKCPRFERIREEFHWNCFRFTNCNEECFTELQWSHSLKYALYYRIFMMLYTIAWFVADVAVNLDPYYITFLTHWGQIVMMMYFIFSFSVVYLKVLSNGNQVHASTRPTGNAGHASEQPTGNAGHASEQPTGNAGHASLHWYEMVTWVLLNIYVTVAFIITVSYWVGVSFDLLAPNKSAASVNTHVHVINSVLAIIELAVGNLPIRILHFYVSVVFGAIYIIFTLILHGAGDISAVYDVLDWQEGPGMATGYVFGILLLAVPLFHIVFSWGIFVLRVYVCKKMGGNVQSSSLCEVDNSESEDTKL